MKARLALMMFLQYFIWGAWSVTLGTWLGTTLHFTGREIGLAAGATAVGAMVSPFLVGLLADRAFATQKLLAVLHGLGALLLWVASAGGSFATFYAVLLVYALCYMPTLSLTNALAMRRMRDPKFEFGPIRVLGTIGWIAAGLLVGGLGLEHTPLPMRLAAGASLLMALYCLTLPDTPPLARAARAGDSRADALALFRGRSLLVFLAASFLICIPLQFYYAFTNLFLNESGVANAAGKMTGGQMSELAFMLLIPWFFRRLGVKYMLGAGMLAWVLRYLLFAFGNAGPLIGMFWAGILLHGICYDFFFVTGQIYIDRVAPAAMRAGAQGIITFITYGAGMLVGSWLSGWVVDLYALPGRVAAGTAAVGHDWRAIWVVAAACSAAVLLLFLASFADSRAPEAAPQVA